MAGASSRKREPPPLVNVLVLLAWSAAAWAAGEFLFRVVVLNYAGRDTAAEVTEVSEGHRGGWKIGYRFAAGDPPRPYTHTDIVSYAESKTPVSEERVEASKRSGTVPVRYWPRDPRINRPADASPVETDLWCPAVGFALTLVMCLFGVVGVYDDWVKRRRARSAVSRAAPPVDAASGRG